MKSTNEQELRERIEQCFSSNVEESSESIELFDTDRVIADIATFITPHTNAGIAKVLDRLEAELNEQKKAAETNLAYHVDVTKNERLIRDWQGTVHGIAFCRPAIAAERSKLKEVK